MQKVLQYLKGDRAIWLIVLLLSGISLLAVYSSTGTLAYREKAGNIEFYLLKHFAIMMLGFAMMYGTHLMPYRYFSKIAQLLLYLCIPLLLYTLFFGSDLNNARRWITLPVIKLSFQTSDLAKLALIMFLARVLSKRQQNIKDFNQGFLPTILPVFLICALIAPADLSTAVVLFITSLLLMFIGRVHLLHIGGLIGITVGAAVLSVMLLLAMPDDSLAGKGRMATWKSRIESFIAGEGEASYQSVQSNIAVAKGGVLGRGPGKSTQRNFLPHPYSDFIYAIIIEEYGLIGGVVILLLYLAFLYRSIRILVTSPKAFGALLAVGLSLSLVLQAMVHMAVSVNLFPVTGLTLPLVSMGGTSLIFTSISIGIILSVSRGTEQKKEEETIQAQENKEVDGDVAPA